MISPLKKIKRLLTLDPLAGRIAAGVVSHVRRRQLETALSAISDSGVDPQFRLNGRELIVSITSHVPRLHELPLTLMSLMQQSVKPTRIVVWLDRKNEGRLPAELSRLEQFGVEIYFEATPMGSYMKLVPSLCTFPEAYILTVDDDLFYERSLIEKLVESERSNPGCIHAGRCHRIRLNSRHLPKPYRKWRQEISDAGVHSLNFFTGCGGVLFPPGALPEETCDSPLFMSLAPKADDVWFWAMARRNAVPVCNVPFSPTRPIYYVENPMLSGDGLFRYNVDRGGNDRQLRAVMQHFEIDLTDKNI